MDEGTVVWELCGLQYWPPPTEEDLGVLHPDPECANFRAELLAHSDGHLEVRVQEGEHLIAHFKSCPIQVPGGNLVIGVSWNEEEIIVSVNGDTLPEHGESESHSVTVKEPEDSRSAIRHPNAESACRSCVNWRRKNLQVKETTLSGRNTHMGRRYSPMNAL